VLPFEALCLIKEKQLQNHRGGIYLQLVLSKDLMYDLYLFLLVFGIAAYVLPRVISSAAYFN
jgi:hypothetical protein